ncbi:MAG: VCBS repeat-containing protein [Myxococcales bacterium]|nr:VCBS repeat-containing protein [Myxococcales bacterium]
MMRDDDSQSSKGAAPNDGAPSLPQTGPDPARPASTRKAPEAPRRETPALAEGTRRPQASLPSFAAVTAPKLDTPKGGGALRGMGESFKHNAATGTWSMSIPLPITPSPRGPSPELSLSYDVGQGQGVFGLGWSLSLPAITRRTDKKIPEYRDSEDSDVFSLAGAEDLTPLHTYEEGPPGTWSWRRHTTRYRPRVEGGFAKIERLPAGDGRSYWQVVTRDNVTHKYGLTSESRIADPANEDRIFTWLLCETRDDRGHVITYHYDAESLDNVPVGKPSEAHRRAGLAPVVANRYLKRVKYGNTRPGDGTTNCFELVFDYGDHTGAPAPGPNVTKACRVDPFSSYRAGFEIRTYRLCKRVLMFHRFQTELERADEIVRALAFTYDETNPHVTKMTGATLTGYTRPGVDLVSQSLPALVFSYSPDALSKRVKDMWDVQPSPTAPGSTVSDFPARTLGKRAQWVDLDGEGIPGILTEEAGALTYKRNLGSARLAPARRLPNQPANTALAAGATQLMDLAGNGELAMVALSGSVRGYQERKPDDWGPFTPLHKAPNVDWDDPNLRLLDLNGDGRDDIFITRGDHFEWYPSEGKEGWGSPRRIPRPRDEEKGPAVVFAGPHSTVYLADMSGDGLADIVRVTSSRVVYWPNLGHGRFGAMVTMDGAPALDPPSQFHPSRVRLADLDGTGTADLVYFSARGMHVFRNRAGNGFATGELNDMVPTADALGTISIIDLLGTGTSSIVWSPNSPGSAPLRYVDLFSSKKPNLLEQIDSSSGLLVRLQHASSVKFYLADKKAGRPWITKLPFPVHVTERVETYDQISKTRLVTTYAYHHGHYDAEEREFRGFGLVEQKDAESFDEHHGQGLFPSYPVENGEQLQAPVLVKTWFHTGDWKNRAAQAAQYATEYWSGDNAAATIPAPTLPAGLTPDELKEACRALRGVPLRVETYGLDGTPQATTPFAVSQHTYEIRKLQPRFTNPAGNILRGCFFTVDSETREYQYERDASDPRLLHSLALSVDAYGTVLQSALVAYARRGTTPPGEQASSLCIVSDLTVKHLDVDPGGYRLAIPIAGKTYQLTGFTGSQTAPTSPSSLKAELTNAATIGYHEPHTSGLQMRTVEHIKLRYWKSSNLPTTLPPAEANLMASGDADYRAILFEAYQLDSTSDLLSQVDGKVTSTILTEGGYVTPSGETGNWIPSGYSLPDASRFYLPISFTDPFGRTTTIAYDTPYTLLVIQITDPLSNSVAASHDYRTLAPRLLTDPNANRVEAEYDALGRVAKIAIEGRAGSSDGDSLLAPTEEFTYETNRWTGSALPNRVKRKAREVHGTTTLFQESYTYTDGSGRIALVKVQAEPGKAPALDGNGNVIDVDADPRWVGSGKTVLNNKGNPVKQYEPFFSTTHEWEDENAIRKWGVTAVVTYDALGRVTKTDKPNGSYRRATWTPWVREDFDENDTVLDTGNLWRAARLATATPTPSAAEQRARQLAEAHAGTPTLTHTDVLGRPFLVQVDNGTATSHDRYDTRTKLDIEGHPLEVTDPLGRTCQTNKFSISGQLLKETNLDRGSRWMFANVAGSPIRRWDERDQTFRSVYDELQRPTHLYLKVGAAAETLLERRYYGEAASSLQIDNLRGQLIRLFDQAGKLAFTTFDFKGNLRESSRQLATDYNANLDWSTLASITNPTTADSTVASSLETETFTEAREYDALNRITKLTTYDKSQHIPGYNRAALLETVDVKIRGASTATRFVRNIEYDAKGQRTKLELGDASTATTTVYSYDPLTFRLSALVTTRTSPSNTLQSLSYTFDPVGNIIAIADAAQQTVFYNNSVVSSDQQFEYDAIYRLKQATGREHSSTLTNSQRDHNDLEINPLPHPNDSAAVRNYIEDYVYDLIGNLTSLQHTAVGSPTSSWTRTYTYPTGTGTNRRLLSTSGGASFGYDLHGNTTSMPHLSTITYSPFDQMKSADKGGGGIVHFTYDASGNRVRKVWEHSGLRDERIYLGAWEIYRRWNGSTKELERETLLVMDGVRRVAMVETKTVDSGAPPFTPTPRLRLQLANHLQTAHLEVDGTGLVISYEEMTPYGTSSYRSAASAVEVSARRYRYTGKERDEETGLDYFGARYYAPWLGRWTSADPLGLQAGLNLYLYGRGSPINFVDPNGTKDVDLKKAVSEGVWAGITGALTGGAYTVYDAVATGAGSETAATLKEKGGAVVRQKAAGAVEGAKKVGQAFAEKPLETSIDALVAAYAAPQLAMLGVGKGGYTLAEESIVAPLDPSQDKSFLDALAAAPVNLGLLAFDVATAGEVGAAKGAGGAAGYASKGAAGAGGGWDLGALLRRFAKSEQTASSAETLKLLESGQVKANVDPSLPSGNTGSVGDPGSIAISPFQSIREALGTIVHEGQHAQDIAKGVIPHPSDLAKLTGVEQQVQRLFAEMRAWSAAGEFAAKNQLTETKAYQVGTQHPRELAINLADQYDTLKGMSDVQIGKALDQFHRWLGK